MPSWEMVDGVVLVGIERCCTGWKYGDVDGKGG